jgi:hypothetical protein
MSLENPFPIFGRANAVGGPQVGITIYVKDITVDSATIEATSGSNGEYIIDIMEIANDTDSIQVWAFGPDAEYGEVTFILDVSGPAKEVNLYLLEAGAYVVKIGWIVAE